MRWDRAQKRADALGFSSVDDYDAAADNNRHAFDDSKWIVVTQRPLPGARLTSSRAKFGRVKSIEVDNFIDETNEYLDTAQASSLPRRLETRDIVTAAIRFCDRFYGAAESDHQAFRHALTGFTSDLAKAARLKRAAVRATSRAASVPAVNQFCSDASERVPSSVSTTTSTTTTTTRPLPSPTQSPNATTGTTLSPVGTSERVRQVFLVTTDADPNLATIPADQRVQLGDAFCADLDQGISIFELAKSTISTLTSRGVDDVAAEGAFYTLAAAAAQNGEFSLCIRHYDKVEAYNTTVNGP